MSGNETGISYKNRKGHTYYLCEISTKTGKCRYAFARKPTGKAISYLPEGYEIVESPNGVVSLRKLRPSAISPDELQAVRDAVRRHNHLAGCLVDVRDKSIIIYEPAPGRRFEPVMRFNLVDEKARKFAAERMCYSGRTHWRNLHGWGAVSDLARQYVGNIGKESFYEML